MSIDPALYVGRVRNGLSTVIVGVDPLPLPLDLDLAVLRVRCDDLGGTGNALDELRTGIAVMLGEPSLLSARELPRGARHLAFDDTPRPAEDALRLACRRLARESGGRAVVLLEVIDAADDASLDTLASWFEEPGKLGVPFLLAARAIGRRAVRALVEVLRRTLGPDAIVGEGAATGEPRVLPNLTPDVLRVLRAASVSGAVFRPGHVARLLELREMDVLEAMQRALDAGVAVVDFGDGRLALRADDAVALEAGLLPSLRRHLHLKSAALLAEDADDDVITMRVPPVDERATSNRRPPIGRASMEAKDEARRAHHLSAAGELEAAAERFLQASRRSAEIGSTGRALSLAERALSLAERCPPTRDRPLLVARSHLEIGRARWLGARDGAISTLDDALTALALAERSLAEHTTREKDEGSASDDSAAGREASARRAPLASGSKRAAEPIVAPPALVAELAATHAGVLSDIGDLASLEQALALLVRATEHLRDAGEEVLAARLLNDQAGLRVRLGDPRGAMALLAESRAKFLGRLAADPEDVVALEELAETEHLLARLPLHVAAEGVSSASAIDDAIEQGLAALRDYQSLGRGAAIGRVRETLGRLELRRGNLAVAEEHLAEALESARRRGDVVGTARASAALAELRIMEERPAEALELLERSIASNLAKGSPVGLAFNRRALAELASRIGAGVTAADPLFARLEHAVARLDRAEHHVGREAISVADHA